MIGSKLRAIRCHYYELVKSGENKIMNCPICCQAVPMRNSFELSSETKERYNQYTHIECGHTLVTHEIFVRS